MDKYITYIAMAGVDLSVLSGGGVGIILGESALSARGGSGLFGYWVVFIRGCFMNHTVSVSSRRG